MATPEGLQPRLERAMATAAEKVRGLIERDPGYYPMYTAGGKWRHGGPLWTDWCAGFLPGQMWILHAWTGDAWWRERAEAYSAPLEPKKHDRAVHDLGFIFLNTYLPWYRRSGDRRLLEVVIEAGRTLAMRYRPEGRYLCSFIGPESLFIDIMMNVPIVFLAARETGDDALRAIAEAHCRTTERTLVRPDGGTAHEGIFDLASGEFLRQSTHQGLRADSDWTRGLAWAIHGFGTVFACTRDGADLAVARRTADHFLERLPDGGVPPWDFDVPEGPERIDDSSAGAIAASGLWQLADLVGGDEGEAYRAGACRILDALLTDRYVAWADPDWEGTLKHGVYHRPKGLGVDESVMWGEFFFLEAVGRALGVRA
jgi:unsaturated chondroitin disaccharide hydrolase